MFINSNVVEYWALPVGSAQTCSAQECGCPTSKCTSGNFLQFAKEAIAFLDFDDLPIKNGNCP